MISSAHPRFPLQAVTVCASGCSQVALVCSSCGAGELQQGVLHTQCWTEAVCLEGVSRVLLSEDVKEGSFLGLATWTPAGLLLPAVVYMSQPAHPPFTKIPMIGDSGPLQ